jgi:hypothetical protein
MTRRNRPSGAPVRLGKCPRARVTRPGRCRAQGHPIDAPGTRKAWPVRDPG